MKLAADKIFINAKAYTMEAEGVCKEAIVIKDGKFDEISALAREYIKAVY